MKKLVVVESFISLEIDETKLTKELMDNYEKYICDINDDSDFHQFNTQLERHIANISWYILRGEDEFIEGYGKLSAFIKKQSVTLSSFDDMVNEE